MTGPAALAALVEKAHQLARLAPDDPEHMPPPEPARFAIPVAWSAATAAAGPSAAIGWLRPAIERAREAGVAAAGYLKKSVARSTLAATNGLFVHQGTTTVGYSMTARTASGNGSGWASGQVNDATALDCAMVADRAIGKALAARNPRPREAAPTTTVLEPAAVRDLVAWLVWHLDRRRYDEGRSFLNGMVEEGGPLLGAAIFGDKASVYSDPLDRAAPCLTHADGLPLSRTPWIDRGRLGALGVDRFWAGKQRLPPQPWPGNIIMPGEGKSLDQLIAPIDDGILVTRIWYLRMLEPQVPLVTALTRDGTFAIRKGEIVGPVNNFRFNESPATLLRRIIALGEPTRVLGSESDLPAAVPPLVIDGFGLSSVSEST
jgi:predicted Zn-dependent protease